MSFSPGCRVEQKLDDLTTSCTSSPADSHSILGYVNSAFIFDLDQKLIYLKRDLHDETGQNSKLHNESIPNGQVEPAETRTTHDRISPEVVSTRLYSRRWLTLFLFCLYSFSNAFQWIHLNIIADVIVNYYNESLPSSHYEKYSAVDWLSLVYMLAYLPLIFPATWLLNKKGLRVCCVWGSLLNAVGAWLKCASVAPDRFALLMFAQTVCAVSQIWVLGTPAPLAASWFGPNEVSTATSLGVFGNQVGVAAGFLLPPILVTNSNQTEVIARGLYIMSYGTAAFTSLSFVLILIFFQEKPSKPPSTAQLTALSSGSSVDYRKSLVRLMTNPNFVLLMIAYGINTGSFYALSTLLNAIVLYYFSEETENAGRIGLTIVLTGIVASVLAGVWLDRTKTFKATTVVIYLLSVAGTVAFTLTLDRGQIWIVFLTSGVLGFFMTGYLPVGFEFAVELTFPESEGTSSGMLNTSATLFGIILTIGMRVMLDSISALSANVTICAFLLAGGVLTVLIKPVYRRQEAGQKLITQVVELEVSANRDPEEG